MSKEQQREESRLINDFQIFARIGSDSFRALFVYFLIDCFPSFLMCMVVALYRGREGENGGKLFDCWAFMTEHGKVIC